MIDGYLPFKNYWIYYKYKKKYIFDICVGFGSYHAEFYKEIGYSKHQIIKCFPNILTEDKLKQNNTNKYEVVIFSYNPEQINPYGNNEYKIKIVSDIIILLTDLKFDNVLVKIKNGYYDRIEIYKKTLDDLKLNIKIDYSIEPTLKILNQTNICIGQISTAFIESIYLNKPYYIYEPIENGISKNILDQSDLFSYDSVSKNVRELKVNISTKKHSFIGNKQKIFDGISSKEINYQNYI